jgi:4-hydroxy-3-polyprenylbenzoate decarboxylase
MSFKDNREFIRTLEETGDLIHIRQEVDWEVEMGAIIRRGCELRSPAILFENVKDYPGHRVLGSPCATYRRFAIALGLAPDTEVRDIYKEYARRIEHPIPPVIVKDGPCKENIMLGDDVDIFRFPAPLVHEGDGGRYVGLWAFEVTKDLHSPWVNWGMYRVMVYDEKHLACMILPPSKHIGIQYGDYSSQKKPMPIAIVVGADPVSSLVSGFSYGAGEDEAKFAGALNREPVELIKCETLDLLAPAHAEIIMEGEVLPDVFVPEGPFGEFTGYRSTIRPQNLIKVKAITYRNDPIFTISNMGIPLHESNMRGIARSVDYEKFLKSLGIPVTGVFMPPEFADMLIVVGVKVTHANMAARVKNAIVARRPSCLHKIVVVDEDVDVFNLNEVLHAFGTKCHPARGMSVSNEYVLPLIPNLTPEERRTGKGAVALIDCTWPIDWPKEQILQKIAFSTYPEEIKNKVVKNWQNYGFK